MHPSEHYFLAELASLLQPILHTFYAFGHHLTEALPALLVAALILMAVGVFGMVWQAHSVPEPTVNWAVS